MTHPCVGTESVSIRFYNVRRHSFFSPELQTASEPAIGGPARLAMTLPVSEHFRMLLCHSTLENLPTPTFDEAILHICSELPESALEHPALLLFRKPQWQRLLAVRRSAHRCKAP